MTKNQLKQLPYKIKNEFVNRLNAKTSYSDGFNQALKIHSITKGTVTWISFVP